MESVADISDQGTLLRNEVELSINIAVDTLTSLTANGDDGCICTLHLLVDGDGSNGNLRILLLTHHLRLEPLGRMTFCLELHAGIGDIFTIDICEGLR